MPVTTKPAPHVATAWGTKGKHRPHASSDVDLLSQSCRTEHTKYFKQMISSSFGNVGKASHIQSFSNGFVTGAIEAYSSHHHLIIRPEDVWFAILTQLSFYINANAEALRDKFVAHDGQKELVTIAIGTLKTADYGQLTFDMGKLIQENIVDPDLREWIMPAFSTTTKKDEVVASVIMMGSMQKYFSYRYLLRCGLPSVTLLGERSDWERMLNRLEKLITLGEEPTRWHDLLRPVLAHFVETFRAPETAETKDFWQKIAHYSGGGSGPTFLSGWITAFCFWDEKGKPLHRPGINPPTDADTIKAMFGQPTPILTLSDVRYHRVDTNDVAPGWLSIPIIVDDNGTLYNTRMVAGSVGVEVSSSKKTAELDTFKPVTGWWIYESKSEDELKG